MMNQNESEKTLIQNLEEFATERGIDCVCLLYTSDAAEDLASG